MKNCMSKNSTVSILVGHINEEGQYVETLSNDVKVTELPVDVVRALHTKYDVAIRLENHVSITVFAKDNQVLNRYLENRIVPNYFQYFFEKMSACPSEVTWYYSDVPENNQW